jgi:hypothetical protein
MRPRQARITMVLGILWLTAFACQRTAVKEPSPVGPSTIHLAFTLSVSPNVLYAGPQRPTAQVRVTVKDGNNPVLGAAVYFTVVSGAGLFADQTPRCMIASNEFGVASTTLLGPLNTEIVADQDIVIRAQLSTDSPQTIFKDATVRVLISPI